jgi:hypothetical protein
MPRKLIKRYLPDKSHYQAHPRLSRLGLRLHDPDLWHVNRRSASGAVALGLFLAWVPVPLQMVLAALGAMALRVNLPIAVAMVWITNPITIPPLFWLAYALGAWLLGHPAPQVEATPSLAWFAEAFHQIWQPLLLGCLVLGVASAGLGYLATRLLWRLHVVRAWEARRRRRQTPGLPPDLGAPHLPARGLDAPVHQVQHPVHLRRE